MNFPLACAPCHIGLLNGRFSPRGRTGNKRLGPTSDRMADVWRVDMRRRPLGRGAPRRQPVQSILAASLEGRPFATTPEPEHSVPSAAPRGMPGNGKMGACRSPFCAQPHWPRARMFRRSRCRAGRRFLSGCRGFSAVSSLFSNSIRARGQPRPLCVRPWAAPLREV